MRFFLESRLFFIFFTVGLCIGFGLGVVAPLLQAVAHGEDLALKAWAGRACQQVQAQGNTVPQGQGTVFPGDQKGRRLAAAFSKWHHG